MKRKLFILLFAGYLLSCGSTKSIKESVSIIQIETDFPVIVRVDIVGNDVFGIDFPLAFEYNDRFFDRRKMDRVDYYYCREYGKSSITRASTGGWNATLAVYQVVKDNLVNITNAPELRGGGLTKGEPKILAYTWHRFYTSNEPIQAELRPYLEQIKQRGTTQDRDTLSVGTFREFQERHPELVKTLLEGDSIMFQLLGRDNRAELDTTFVLPIRF
jgi:hypothetical protein